MSGLGARARRAAVLLLACALPSWAWAEPAIDADDTRPVARIGVLHHRGHAVAERMWGPTVRYLQREIPGYHFDLVPLDYSALDVAVAKGAVDFTLTAAGQYVGLELRHGVTRIATIRNSGPLGDFSEYGGVLVTRANRDDIRTLADIRGKTLLIPDRLSFGGWLMQQRELKALGLEADEDFTLKEVGDHEKSLLGVLDGEADVGAARSDMLERMVAEGRADARKFRLLVAPTAPRDYPYWLSTRVYPNWPLAKLRGTDDQLAQKVVIALLNMPADSEAARAAEIAGWTVPRDYQPVNELFRELRLGPYANTRVTWADVVRSYWDRIMMAALALATVLLASTVWVSRANHRLGEQKDRTEAYLETVGTMIVVLAPDGRVEKVNRRACEVLERGESELVGGDWMELAVPPDWRDRVRQVFRHAVDGAQPLAGSYENEVLTARGERRLVHWNNRAVVGPDGRVRAVIAAGEDVTVQRAAEGQIRLYARVFESSLEGVVICDAQVRIVSVNPAFCDITGYSPDEVIGRNPRLLASGRQEAAFYREMWEQLTQEGRWQGELWNRRKDGSAYPESLSINTLRDARGAVTHYIGVFSDISRQKEDQARIHNLAYYDALTGLPNRTLLADRFEQAAAMAHRRHRGMAMLFIDLDRFKQVNDTLGHVVGDELLRAVAVRFGLCLRDSDTLARRGGDEFIALLPDLAAPEDASHVAQKCLAALEAPVIVGGQELRVTPSIGIALHPDDGATLDALVKSADTAMYAAKDAGRNTYRFFTADMNTRMLARMVLEHELRLALERRELEVHYQPQVCIPTGRVLGFEALVRWRHPDRGLVPPGTFIEAAEESGLIVPMGRWVLREACRQGAAWHAAGHRHLRVAVNVSAAQLRAENFCAEVEEAFTRSGLPAGCLELELTESLLIQDAGHTPTLLEDLKALGVHLSVDDFGTGYSSLAYLKRFPVNRLKVDRSFVRDLTTDSNDRAIASSIIALGHHLGLRVIAEGVETAEQLTILEREGCDEYQGYLFGRPAPAAELSALLERVAI